MEYPNRKTELKDINDDDDDISFYIKKFTINMDGIKYTILGILIWFAISKTN